MKTTAYIREAEAFVTSLTEEYYQNGAGLKDALEIVAIYQRHSRLFERETAAALITDRATRESRYLAHFAASGFVENQLREATERIGTAETQAVVEWRGDSIPYRQASVLIANEPDRTRRHDLEQHTAATTAQLNPERVARLTRAHQIAEELGFQDYVEMSDSLAGLHLSTLAPAMERLLTDTRARYLQILDARLSAAAIPPAEATTGDLTFLGRGKEFDHLFPKHDVVPALQRTLPALGIDIEAQPNLTLDVEERPLKSPRAFCAPVRVPQDVRLVIKPRGGHDDYAAILHEAGHSEHFAHVRADAPFAYRYLGDNSITEAYAFLFDGLSRNPRWLRNVMGARETDDYLFLVRFSHLLLLRRYGAKLPYELELHRAPDPSTFGGRYGEGLGDALRLRIWRENFLHDLDDWFYCACYLRAWILEVQLRAALVDRFGDHWFAAKGAGDFLKEIWSLGQELSAEELAQRIGYSGLDASLLITDLLSPIGD